MEHTSRALEVSANPVTISFGFQVIPGEATISKVTVDFGDGVTEEVGSQAVLEHTYTCQSDLCTYEATLRGADDEGMAWVETPLNKVRIIQIP
jgi:hypothetical protein